MAAAKACSMSRRLSRSRFRAAACRQDWDWASLSRASCRFFTSSWRKARTFTASGLKVGVEDGKLVIHQEGKVQKLIPEVEQVTFSGDYAAKHGQPVLYVTERAVFELTTEGVELKEIAPGVDLQKDVLDQMGFTPIMKDVKTMDSRIFQAGPMGLAQ